MIANLRIVAAFSFALVFAPGIAWSQTAGRDEAALLDFFEKKVRPVLAENCFNCHSANTNSRGGLRVDDRNGLLQGGGRGPAVVPGQPGKSLLIQAVGHTHQKLKMPPKKQLSAQQIADLTQWIKDGAAWPRARVPASVGKYTAEYDRLRKTHWAWQPLREVPVPVVRDTSWARGEIDRYILARLEGKGLKPVSDADRTALIRRVAFDLTGLPPSPQEVETFTTNRSPDAFEKVVDRLLATPAFGERWGRHWLDVARYGESTGSARNLPYPHAWRYRDYVIDAFNSDRPYDQFLLEQIAGDLLPAGSPQQRDERLIATGFLALGVRDVNQRFKVRFVMDNVDEQIDTVSRAVLALTVSCARCHDHKFDPIPTTDYYALAGIFRSTDLCAGLRNKMGGGGLDYYDTAMLLRLGPGRRPNPKLAEKVESTKAALASARAEFEALVDTPEGKAPGPDGRPKQVIARQKITLLQKELIALSDPALHGPVALGVRDSKAVSDTELRIRGEAEKLGPVVPRGFLSVLDVPGSAKINPHQSGRLELVQWLTSPKNPLTPRVMVNRVWKHLFGQGLVSSVDNFGITGDVPSHPELLDHLAARFVRDGWSVKKLVRALVLSRTYQLSAEAPAANLAVDPANRLLWRHSPRRLDAEEIRDSMLAAAGTLNRNRLRGSPAQDLKVIELPNNAPLAKRLEEEALASRHRSVYLPLVRGLTPRSLEVFDFAEQGMVTGSRDTTTVATQALYLLNDPFVRQQAQALAERLLKRTDLDDASCIRLAYRLTVGRVATAQEVERAHRYLAEYEAEARAEETPPAEPRAAAWASFGQALLASAEFRYIR
ncbi:MAG: PSD1 and planctomycete cytochrome C domain-containing protein [Gemmataceae bacterium]|nr:PSD1 and planctomycete cytochrome C domain-containing protein [Gemmataceae bacterium]